MYCVRHSVKMSFLCIKWMSIPQADPLELVHHCIIIGGIVRVNSQNLWSKKYSVHNDDLFWGSPTHPSSPYSTIVDQTASAIFAPECMPISSQKSMSNSSISNINKCTTTTSAGVSYTVSILHLCSALQWPKMHVHCLMSMCQVRG